MKKQIKRLSPHQNGKVFGVLMAVATLPIFLPMILMMNLAGPSVGPDGNTVGFPTFVFFIFPLLYLIFGYISVVIGCFFYNILNRFIGGFEFLVEEVH
ncbi:hypothetical protein [Marinobacter salarius]|jgi:hypothetical protein|uniref:DUF3566 domain-containing protein n=1 Tax=Marinobacter salarius TaxID=1420917 RepID=A0A1W6KEK8_9GAMM|nr:hypothetical protein [Marinobacter salarius]ARM85752.1 hypothetical protein MARSALSMR5_03732 [Marinobacter salarius]